MDLKSKSNLHIMNRIIMALDEENVIHKHRDQFTFIFFSIFFYSKILKPGMTKSIFERYIKKLLNFINKGNGIAHFFSAVFVACKTI